jgi:hypothetical protein
MSQHNRGQHCTNAPNCQCSKHCLCRHCLFDRKSLSLYSGLRGRLAAKKWKTGERAGEIRRAKIDTPYTIEQFRAWLRVVLEDTPWCCYCLNPVDITTISPDHARPWKRGGSLALSNLRCSCDDCNRLKGLLLPGEFKALMEGLKTLTEDGRRDVIRRLKGGILHFGNKSASTPPELKGTNILALPAPKADPDF